MMQPSGACQHLSGTCNFHLFTYLYSVMIVLLYKCSLLGHTFFFLPHHFLGLLFDICHFLTKQRMTTFGSCGCLSLTLILIIVCLQKEALLKAAFFLTSGEWTLKLRKEDDAKQKLKPAHTLMQWKEGKNIYNFNKNKKS